MRALVAVGVVCLLVGADPPADAVKKDMAAMDGEWALIDGERDGQQFSEEDQKAKPMKREVKDGVSTVTARGDLVIKSKFTVDPGKKPKQIDFEAIEGAAKGTKLHGIYEFDGDTLKLCLAAAGENRPTDFTAKTGTGRTLTVWKKVKK
jgi:uncharacterized protein (TIGR03067 family)